MLIKFFDFIGNKVIEICDGIGSFSFFIFDYLKNLFFTKLKFSKLFFQMEQIGVNSLFMSIITGAFTGAVLVIQSYKGFKQFNGQHFIGSVVTLSMVRELGPVLSGFIVAGKSASSIAAEIGTMQISEQIDALRTLRINIFQYLIVPRILADTIILPFLTLFSMIGGIAGGYLIAVQTLKMSSDQFTSNIKQMVEFFDVIGGLIKAAFFGFTLTTIGCFMGYHTKGGAKGVGVSTTKSVVYSFISILIINYFLAIILFNTGN